MDQKRPKKWDAFISHASEDKSEFVRPLAGALTDSEVTVWYDEFSLNVGDSLSRSIDCGLTNSQYGIVVLSKKFFEKNWTKKELGALESKAIEQGKNTLLPVWHKITKKEVSSYSATLADLFALNSNNGVKEVAEKLATRIKGKLNNGANLEPRISSFAIDQYIFDSKWDLKQESDEFHYTEGIDLDSRGYIYVADEGGFVRKLNPIGKVVKKFGGRGEDPGRFENAYALAIDASDHILVSDSQGRIQVFDIDGNLITTWGSRGSGDGQFDAPYGIAIDIFGNIFVSEEANHRIQKFDDHFNFLTKWGSNGDGDGEFKDPIGIATDTIGNIYVADNINNRIQVFDNNGNFITKWGSSGTNEGQFNRPHGITLDSKNVVYVTDSMNHRIQKFTKDGIFLNQWGSNGEEDGQLKVPRDLVVDKNGVVYVSDGTNHRVQIFCPDSKTLNMLIESRKKFTDPVEHNQLNFYIDQLENVKTAGSAWQGLGRMVVGYIPIWAHGTLWTAISNEVLRSRPQNFTDNALDLLRNMLYTADKLLGRENEVASKAHTLYLEKMIEILESIDATWQYQKSFAKQLVDLTTNNDERLAIFWKGWKKCALIENGDVYIKFVSHFINDLENAPLSFKNSIEPEIFKLMKSDNVSAPRAKQLYSLM